MIVFLTDKEACVRLAQLMRQHRVLRGYTQAECARRSGVALANVRKFEQSGGVSLKNFIKLAPVLDVLEPLLQSLQLPEARSLKDLVSHKSVSRRKRVRL